MHPLRLNLSSFRDLVDRLNAVCRDIERRGSHWLVFDEAGYEPFMVVPATILDDAAVPRDSCWHDPEYGWPELVDIDAVEAPGALRWCRRKHPIYLHQGRPIARALSLGEYRDLQAGLLASGGLVVPGYCTHCGSALSSPWTERDCGRCGSPRISSPLQADSAQRCPACHAVQSAATRHCASCGREL